MNAVTERTPLARTRFDAATRRVDAGGLRWTVSMFGHGPAMLMLHGTGASSHSFSALAEALADDFTIVVPDLPGHAGTSRASSAGMSLDGMAAAMAALLDVLDVVPAIAIGHSAGAAILVRMALDRRLDLRALVGLNAALLPLDGVLRVLSPMAKLMSLAPGLPRLVSGLAKDPRAVQRLVDGTGSRIEPEGTRRYAELVQDRHHVAGAIAMMAAWNLDRTFAQMPALSPAPLLIVGDNDRTVPPRQADRVAARIPGTRVVVLPGLGHLAHEEAPRQVASLIAAHARERNVAEP